MIRQGTAAWTRSSVFFGLLVRHPSAHPHLALHALPRAYLRLARALFIRAHSAKVSDMQSVY